MAAAALAPFRAECVALRESVGLLAAAKKELLSVQQAWGDAQVRGRTVARSLESTGVTVQQELVSLRKSVASSHDARETAERLENGV
jgi:hypothetical protein